MTRLEMRESSLQMEKNDKKGGDADGGLSYCEGGKTCDDDLKDNDVQEKTSGVQT